MINKCLKCGNVSLKSNFHKDENEEDGSQPHCLSCRTQYCIEKREETRKYYLETRDKIKFFLLKIVIEQKNIN